LKQKNPVKFVEYTRIRNAVSSQITALCVQEQYDISVSSKDNPKNSGSILIVKEKLPYILAYKLPPPLESDCGPKSLTRV